MRNYLKISSTGNSTKPNSLTRMLEAHIKDDFKNLLEYRQWVDQKFNSLSESNKVYLDRFDKDYVEQRIARNPTWYGSDTSYEEMSAGITQYKSPQLIETIYEQVNDRISTAVRNKINAKKMRYNATGLGVFVFDRAVMGMYRLREYYSHSLKKVVDRSEVIHSDRGCKLAIDHTKVTERWEQKPDGKPKVRTTNKHVFAWFPPQSKEKRSVELFISCGGHSGITAEQFLYSGVAAIIVAQLLEKAHIPTRITIVIGSSPDGFEEQAYVAIIPVKNYDESLDINLLALLTSDPRFFRFEGFKGLVALYDHFEATIPSSFGTGMTRDHLIETIEESSYSKTAKLAPNRFYFGWTFSSDRAVEQINTVIEEMAERLNE